MLSPLQKEAISFAESDDETCLAVGTIRSGKTFSLTIGFGLQTQALPKAFQHLILGRKLRVLESEVLPTMKIVAQMCGIPYEYLRGEHKVRMGTQTYYLIAGNDERSQDGLTGKTIHSVLIDEATLLPKSFFETGLSRMTYGDSKAWITCNPSYPLHYIKEEYLDKGLFDKSMSFSFEDNPSLSEKAKARYRRLFSGVFARRLVDGLWAAADGLVWPDYEVRPAPDGKLLRTDIGMDYGIASTTAWVVLETYRQSGEILYYIPYVHGVKGGPTSRNATDAELVDELVTLTDTWSPQSVIIDPSAASFTEALYRVRNRKFHVRKGKNDVIPGLRLTGSALAHGVITINPECAALIKELESYGWDETKPDVPIKANDHYCDALRYVVMDRVRKSYVNNVPLPEGM